MRFKWVPEPPETLDDLGAVHRAVPLVPTSESDCQHRLVDRTAHIGDRESASEWLTFLRALGVVEQVSRGYRRRRLELTTDELFRRLQDGIYGARELYDVLAAASHHLAVETMLDRGADLPTWERHHQVNHQEVHRRRGRRLADWFVLCGIAEKTAAGYRLVEPER